MLLIYLVSCINLINHWASSWSLPILSVEKTRLMEIGAQNSSRSYFINNVPLTKVDEVCDLGFTVDKRLKFDLHCKKIVRNANHRLYNLFKSLSTNDPTSIIFSV
ncbi:hypothetical protein Y032_0838g2608 [Ancylostoma ceylanicum]|uniref:Uncharacterized protein n=1 Tax=Ancylostoma ceylanicum TaxID=53326 RepID=A0A016WBK1_9BILA|nr:hypothetical protein Y032_0838g2608 [Ancylostoma ceylanicum]